MIKSKQFPQEKKKPNFDILRLKNIAPDQECKGTLRDVQPNRSHATLSSCTLQSSSCHRILISKLSTRPDIPPVSGLLIVSFFRPSEIQWQTIKLTCFTIHAHNFSLQAINQLLKIQNWKVQVVSYWICQRFSYPADRQRLHCIFS